MVSNCLTLLLKKKTELRKTFNVCVSMCVCVFMDMKSIQTEFVCQADFMDICVK